MRTNNIFRICIGGVIALFLLSACNYQERLKTAIISDITSQTGDAAFAIKLCVASCLLFEGGSKPVGILNEMQIKDLEEIFGDFSTQMKTFKGEIIFWTFELIPEMVQLEGEQVIVIGRKGKKNTFYFAALPKTNRQVVRLFSLIRKE